MYIYIVSLYTLYFCSIYHIYMNLIEQRTNAGGSITDLRSYLQVVQWLLKTNSVNISQSSMLEEISKASPEVADVISLLDHMWLLWHAQIQKLFADIDRQKWGYVVQTSHPDFIKNTLGDVSQVSNQDTVGVQVSKWWNIYKRSFETDVHKILS